MKAINPDGSDEYKYESDYCNIHREYLNPRIPNVRSKVKLAPIVTIPEQHERLNKFKKDQNKIKEWWQYQMKFILISLLIVAVFLPEMIKFIRIKHMKALGYRYEGDELVKIHTNNHKID